MDDAELRRQIVGTWALVSVVYEDVATRERTSQDGRCNLSSVIGRSRMRFPVA
jgi:hypothetical protein